MTLNAELLRSSLDLVISRQPQITPRFYEILFERYPQAKPLFSRNAPEKQAKMLQDAIVAVIDHLEDADWLTEQLGAMGATHIGYGVTEEMYPWVTSSLLATLAEIGKDDWTDQVANAWKDALDTVASLMIAGAKRAN